MRAEKHCWVFHFANPEKILELISASAAEKEKTRSLSFGGSFRRASQMQVRKAKKADDRDLEQGEAVSPTHTPHNKKNLDVIHDENEN
jgi:hypothetical protein